MSDLIVLNGTGPTADLHNGSNVLENGSSGNYSAEECSTVDLKNSVSSAEKVRVSTSLVPCLSLVSHS